MTLKADRPQRRLRKAEIKPGKDKIKDLCLWQALLLKASVGISINLVVVK
jgi:hypothetical protein